MFFHRILQSLQLYTRIALRALKVSYNDVGEGGVAVNCEKTQFFLNTLYLSKMKDSPGLCGEEGEGGAGEGEGGAGWGVQDWPGLGGRVQGLEAGPRASEEPASRGN